MRPAAAAWLSVGVLALAGVVTGQRPAWAGPAGDGDRASASQTSTELAAGARPGGGEPIGVLEVATYGVSETAGDKFEESVEETLAGVGFRAVRRNVLQKQLARGNYVVGCTVGPCMHEVLKLTGLRRVLVARIQGAGQSYSVVVSLVDTDRGRLISQVAQSCPVCTVEEAISTATLAVVELITGNGKHAVDGAGAGGDPGGPAEDGERLAHSRRRVRRAGWLFLTTGVVAGAVGGYLLATDHKAAGGPAAGAGGALALTGLTTLIISTTF